VTYLNLVIFFLAVSFSSIALLVFADASLGFVLLQVLNIPNDPTQPLIPTGSKAGQVVLYSEIVICATIWIWGMISDRIGRRFVFFAGTVFIAASFLAMPFAQSFIQIIGIRLVFAPGAAATSAMLMALICDYPRDDAHNKSRFGNEKNEVLHLFYFFIDFLFRIEEKRALLWGFWPDWALFFHWKCCLRSPPGSEATRGSCTCSLPRREWP
jgi:hypothetical protein